MNTASGLAIARSLGARQDQFLGTTFTVPTAWAHHPTVVISPGSASLT
jgi:hypothetical protein